MPSKLIGPDYEDFTVSSGSLRWLHSCRWEEALPAEFLKARSRLRHSLGKAPKSTRKKGRESARLAAQWLLVDEDDRPLAWAELQSFPQRFDISGWLLWDFIGETKSGEALAPLLGLCFTVGRFDRLTTVGQTTDLPDEIKALADQRHLLVLRESPWFPGGAPFEAIEGLEFLASAWKGYKQNNATSLTLKAIESRVQRQHKAGEFGKKRKRRGLLARLLRPKVDDSLF